MRIELSFTGAAREPAPMAFAGHWRDAAARRADAAIHLLGALAGLVAAPALLAAVRSEPRGTHWPLIAYAFALAALFPASALFQHGPAAWRHVTIKIDHAAIHLKIAASGGALAAAAGVEIGSGLWAVALGGAALRAAGPARMRGASLSIYLAVLLAALVALQPVLAVLVPGARGFAVLGGAIYLAGLFVHLGEGARFHQAIWHMLVLAGSAAVCAAVLIEAG